MGTSPGSGRIVDNGNAGDLKDVFLFDGGAWKDEFLHAWVEDRYPSQPIPAEVVDGALSALGEPDLQGRLIYRLAKARGAELLPWTERLLENENAAVRAWGAIAMAWADVPRALKDLATLVEGRGPGGVPGIGVIIRIADCLSDHTSPEISSYRQDLIDTYIRKQSA